MRAIDLQSAVLGWYDDNARDLPWRQTGTDPWAVLVSEVMLQQTPVARVLPAYRAWLQRWPSAPVLAAAPVAEVIRQWGRLGYPRRAIRLHQTATVVTADHGGRLPEDYDALRRLPGVGKYTAAAVSVFAFGSRLAVLDTNVRRVLGRAIRGEAFPPLRLTDAERAAATALLPAEAETAARWSVAVMELGALVCTARRPSCHACPVVAGCAWEAAGTPGADDRPLRRQPYPGTDRQCRGVILAQLRETDAPIPTADAAPGWPAVQRARALDSLVADGLVASTPDGRLLTLP